MATRFLMGEYGTNDPRFRMSKPAENVMAALAPEKLAFDSTWVDTGIIIKKGQIFVPNPSPNNYVQVNFDEQLPSIPFLFYFRQVNTDIQRQGTYWSNATGVYYPYYARMTRDWIRFVPDNSFNAANVVIQFVVFRPIPI